MNRANARHVGLGVAGALVTSSRAVARLSLWAARKGAHTPLAAPLLGPARRLIGDAEHRGALNEARLLSDAKQIVERVVNVAGARAAEPIVAAPPPVERPSNGTPALWLIEADQLRAGDELCRVAGFECGAAPA